MRKLRSHRAPGVLFACLIAVGSVFMPSPGFAKPSQAWPVCNFGTHPTSHQFTNNLYLGQEGAFYTFQPNVPDLNTEFSLSHLYPFRDNYNPWVELGWYRGYGPQKKASNSSYFTAMNEVGSGYIEHDFQDAPNATIINYLIENEGFDNVTGKYIWRMYTGTSSWQFLDVMEVA